MGTDKGLFNLMGKPFISYQLEVLSQLSKNVFVVANSKAQVNAYLNEIDFSPILAFIIDDTTLIQDLDFRNPMLGLYSTFKELKQLNYKKVLVLSCDNPLIKTEVIELMIKSSYHYDCVIPKWDSGFLEPLFAIYPVFMAFSTAKQNILHHRFKITNIIDKTWKTNYLSVEGEIKNIDPNLLSFRNLNKISEVKEIEQLLANSSKKKKRKI